MIVAYITVGTLTHQIADVTGLLFFKSNNVSRMSLMTLIIISLCVVGLFILAISLTFIFKGHHIESEIGENKNMKELGIRCAADQIRREEAMLRGETAPSDCNDCSESGCGGCSN